ncbi:MAG TPA: RusA family crossover junction endodeoxyribonuclease [Planctomycetota bacterium]|nr:RusA family crossover junction endodeoxyribonuclease [Planctomycetota bacterium]
MVVLTLPYAPSANHYWRRVGYRTLISREGRAFREKVCKLLGGSGRPPISGRIALCMDAFPPDRRRRNLDNLQKPSLDSLQHAGVYEDDSQIDLLISRRMKPVPNGQIIVRIQSLPLSICPICGSGLS